jgi:methyl-accepting chemotaxis protein
MEANRRRIQATAQEAAHSSELAAALSTTGEEGAKSLQSLNQSIAAVVQRTGEIQEVVQIILDIADRSSLLSMNAAIEAAHAGASGKGFAVVAEEIRKLANTSAQQAQTIKSLLGGIAAATETTRARSEATELSFQSLNSNIEAVRQAGTSISQQMKLQEAEDDRLTDGLVEFTNFYALLATSMEEQMSRSQQVKHLVDEVSDASQQISHSMTEQKIGMEQATEAVIQVRETAVQLATIISSLRDEVARFRLS